MHLFFCKALNWSKEGLVCCCNILACWKSLVFSVTWLFFEGDNLIVSDFVREMFYSCHETEQLGTILNALDLHSWSQWHEVLEKFSMDIGGHIKEVW